VDNVQRRVVNYDPILTGPTEVAGQNTSVVVVDDDDLFRRGIAEILRAWGLDVVGTARSGEEAVRVVAEVAPDVVLMDLAMPGLSGVETTRRLAETAPAAIVLVLAMSAEQDDVVEAMIAGASGYILKGTAPETLVANIRVAAAGECVMSASIAAKLFSSVLKDAQGTEPADVMSPLLSEREVEILKLIAEGKQNADIATALVISPFTARNHISNVLRKLQVENRTQAAAYATKHGLV
jgi:DNA-binding NarL/FixJ family response regulator